MQAELTALIENYKETLLKLNPDLISYLIAGDLHHFENTLYQSCTDLYNQIAFVILSAVAQSEELKQKAQIIGQKKGLKEIRKSAVKLQLKTGAMLTIFSWYASPAKSKRKTNQRGPNGTGCHLLLEYWGCLLKATPAYYSYISILSILCPSFDIVLQILKDQHIPAEYKRIKKIAYQVGEQCFSHRVRIGLKPHETVAGKRVIISVDGGRTRLREPNPAKQPSPSYQGKRAKFDTPWREPKLFVIHILDRDGSIIKTELPIYDAVINDADCCFDLLADYLKKLKIATATEILVIADGADWIWNRAKAALLKLDVSEQKITEAIDYYHAVEHISDIISKLPKLDNKKKTALFKELKDLLWDGKLEQFMLKVTDLANGRKLILDKLSYFQKNVTRMQYQLLRKNKLPCGSGIVESAIRRVINLRFKSPSTFWNQANVEKLIFLRAIFLAGRWNIMINNLIKLNHKFLQQNLKLVCAKSKQLKIY
jgi:hypothetical protein